MVAFSNEDEPVGRLKEWNENAVIRDQVLIFAKHGFFMEIRQTARISSCRGGDLRPWYGCSGASDEH